MRKGPLFRAHASDSHTIKPLSVSEFADFERCCRTNVSEHVLFIELKAWGIVAVNLESRI